MVTSESGGGDLVGDAVVDATASLIRGPSGAALARRLLKDDTGKRFEFRQFEIEKAKAYALLAIAEAIEGHSS